MGLMDIIYRTHARTQTWCSLAFEHCTSDSYQTLRENISSCLGSQHQAALLPTRTNSDLNRLPNLYSTTNKQCVHLWVKKNS